MPEYPSPPPKPPTSEESLQIPCPPKLPTPIGPLQITPSLIANWLMTRTLREITKLQFELAKEGIVLQIQTADIELLDPGTGDP